MTSSCSGKSQRNSARAKAHNQDFTRAHSQVQKRTRKSAHAKAHTQKRTRKSARAQPGRSSTAVSEAGRSRSRAKSCMHSHRQSYRKCQFNDERCGAHARVLLTCAEHPAAAATQRQAAETRGASRDLELEESVEGACAGVPR